MKVREAEHVLAGSDIQQGEFRNDRDLTDDAVPVGEHGSIYRGTLG